MLNKIRECAAAALTDSEAVAGRLTDTCKAEQKDQQEAMERTLAKDEERIQVLEKMVLRLYEDMVAGRITEANFNLLLEKTQKEQAELKAKVEKGRKHLADEIRLAVDARQWVESIQEYKDITELDASILNRLIKEIVVHETIDSDKTRSKFILISNPYRKWSRSQADRSPAPGDSLKTPYIFLDVPPPARKLYCSY